MKAFITIILIFVIGGVVFFYRDNIWSTGALPQTATSTPDDTRAMSIEEYVKLNISSLSARAGAEEVLGGKFYVTSIEAHGGAGTVEYEDGHIAFTADFTYSIDASHGAITIDSFLVRK